MAQGVSQKEIDDFIEMTNKKLSIDDPFASTPEWIALQARIKIAYAEEDARMAVLQAQRDADPAVQAEREYWHRVNMGKYQVMKAKHHYEYDENDCDMRDHAQFYNYVPYREVTYIAFQQYHLIPVERLISDWGNCKCNIGVEIWTREDNGPSYASLYP